MRFLSLLRKTAVENVRDWKILVMTLTFAPFFVFLMYFYFDEATVTYRVVVVNHDAGQVGAALVRQLRDVRSAEGGEILRVREEATPAAARERVRAGRADLAVEIPADFTRALEAHAAGDVVGQAVIRSYGDGTNVNSLLAMAFSDYLAYEYAARVTGDEGPLRVEAMDVGTAQAQDEFGRYVPGLLALALMMLMFTAAASIIKEKDKGTLVRLRLSNMTTFEWLAAVSVTQCVIGVVALGLTLLTAMALDYRPLGSLPAAVVVCLVSSMAIMGISLMVAAALRTIFDLVTIGSFPFFVLMFFSGGMFPLPDVRLFTLGDRAININDILPTTHSITAFDRILTAGGGLGDVWFELGAIALLTVGCFSIGGWTFVRRHMRA
jgi:ABC-2 type transport system permease protein